MKAQAAAFISRRWSVPEALLRLDVLPLPGGLESSVARVRIAPAAGYPSLPGRLVVKELRQGFEREADVYAWLWRRLERPPAVTVLGRETLGNTTYLYLEDAEPFTPWPWSDPGFAAAVCRALARFHEGPTPGPGALAWNYDAELLRSADATLQLAIDARAVDGRRCWRRAGDMRRVVANLPAIRAHLLAGNTTVIHGDVHPGNVCIRGGSPDTQVVFIDWGRARIGSPLEDVAAWLHSLGCWEPVARRGHDSLLRTYLEARGIHRGLTGPLRLEYWFASVSNGLSGAIRYHLSTIASPSSSESARYHSQRALAAWERVVRQAARILSTSSARCM